MYEIRLLSLKRRSRWTASLAGLITWPSTSQKSCFGSELGNNTVDVIDLATRRSVHRIAGLQEPQGVAVDAAANFLVVANGGTGSVALFRADDFAPLGRVELVDDADNTRVDVRTGRSHCRLRARRPRHYRSLNPIKIADVRRDGTVKIVTMGRRIVGKWKVKAGQLCIEAPKPENSQCREVWRSNDKFQLRAPGDPVPYDVTIQKQQQRSW